MGWVRIGSADDLAHDEGMAVEVGARKLALFRCDGAFYVTDNVCTHQYALLSEGFVEDGCVECPLHEARFDLRSGKALCAPATSDVKVYRVRIDGNEIYADL